MAKRRQTHPVAALALVMALALLALLVWWTMQKAPLEPRTAPQRAEVPRPNPAPEVGGEDFSAAERQRLEDILKHRGSSRDK